MEKLSGTEMKLKASKYYLATPPHREDCHFIKSKSHLDHSLVYYLGIIRSILAVGYCNIREYTAPVGLVLKKAKIETGLIEKTEFSNGFAQCLGFYIEIHENKQYATYILISRHYNRTLIDIVDDQRFNKLMALEQIFNSLFCLHKLEAYYGALDVSEIFVDDKNNAILGNLFCSNYCKKGEWLDINTCSFNLFVGHLIAPEILIILKTMSSQRLETDLLDAIDIFSFGSICYYLFTGDRSQLKFSNEEMNTEGLFDFIVFGKKNSGSILHIMIDKKRAYSLDLLVNVDPLAYAIIESCFKLKRNERASMDSINNQITSYKTKLEQHNKTELQEILVRFCLEIKELMKSKESEEDLMHIVSSMASNMLSTYQIQFDEAYKRFLNSPCDDTQDYNLDDGILYLIRSLCVVIMKKGDCLRKIIEKIIYYCPREDYSVTLSTLYSENMVVKDYVITGLSLANLEYDDIKYFFPKTRETVVKSRIYFKFADYTKDLENFKKVALHPRIVEMFSEFNRNIDIEVAILQIVNRAYYYEVQPSLYGLTTYKGNVYISLFGVSDPKKMSVVSKVAAFITLLHEIAHSLRRFRCQTYKEAKNVWTPPNDLAIYEHEEQGLTEYELRTMKGEAGFSFEMKLFGEIISRINYSAAKYFLSADFNDIPKFQSEFKKMNENVSGGTYVMLSRPRGAHSRLSTCGFSNITISRFIAESEEDNQINPNLR